MDLVDLELHHRRPSFPLSLKCPAGRGTCQNGSNQSSSLCSSSLFRLHALTTTWRVEGKKKGEMDETERQKSRPDRRPVDRCTSCEASAGIPEPSSSLFVPQFPSPMANPSLILLIFHRFLPFFHNLHHYESPDSKLRMQRAAAAP